MNGKSRHNSIGAMLLLIVIGYCALAASASSQPSDPGVTIIDETPPPATTGEKKDLTPPPRTIDDITQVLVQDRPDPRKITELKAAAERPVIRGAGGMNLADFYFKRGNAAFDLGRAQQALVDMREAWRLAKPTAMQAPNWAAFTRKPGSGLHPPGGRGFGTGYGPGSPDFGIGHGRGAFRSGMFRRASLAERVPPNQQHAFRIFQRYINFEAKIGDPRRAAAIYQEVRPHLLSTLPGFTLGVDGELVTNALRTGNIEDARLWIARMQQLNAKLRENAKSTINFNVWWASIETALGSVQLASGKLAEAEATFRHAMHHLELTLSDVKHWESEKPVAGTFEGRIASVRLNLAQSLARQGKLIEAEIETRRALLDILHLRTDAAPQTASAVLVLADILQAQGRYSDAQRIAEAALDIYVRGGVETVHHADALQRIAVDQASQRQWQSALDTYDKMRKAVASNPAISKRYVDGNLDLALVLIRSGQAATAVTILEGILKQRIAQGQSEYDIAVARGFLGTALAAAGRIEDALQILRAAVPVLILGANDSAREEGALDELNRRQMIFDGYFTALMQVRGTALEKQLGLDATDEAFRISDMAHAKSVQSAIVASSARAASGQTALGDLIRSAQDAGRRLVATKDLMRATLDAPAGAQTQEAVQSLRKDIAQLQAARQTLSIAIERQFPQYAQLVNPKPVGIEEARSKLYDGDVLIVTYFSGGTGYVWAVPKQGEVAFAQIALPESGITALVDKLRDTVDSPAMTAKEIPPFPVTTAHALYAALLEPVATSLVGAKNIIVVPDGALGKLPFSLLVTRDVPQPQERDGVPLFAGYRDVPFLIRKANITHVPSVVAFASLRSAPAGAVTRKPFIGFGDPVFSVEQEKMAQNEQNATEVIVRGAKLTMRAAPNTSAMEHAGLAQLPSLPDTADEVREVAKALGADPVADVLLGAMASERTVRTIRLDDRRVVMFATHGLVPYELDGLVQPALALSSPEVPGVEGDGLLTVDKILGLKLDADWVILSACNTAAPEGGGAEAISGLGRAFFYAGARALLVTNWPVETESARELTTALFRRQAATPNLSRAEALRESMIEMITKGERDDFTTKHPIFTYAHPMFWAPFSLVGDGESSPQTK